MSKTFARSSLCALGMTILTAQAAEPPKEIGKGEGRLDIIAWPGYIERGQTDKAYDWVTRFEQGWATSATAFTTNLGLLACAHRRRGVLCHPILRSKYKALVVS
jgi:spermidine/putrescine-binding protein